MEPLVWLVVAAEGANFDIGAIDFASVRFARSKVAPRSTGLSFTFQKSFDFDIVLFSLTPMLLTFNCSADLVSTARILHSVHERSDTPMNSSEVTDLVL